MTELTSVRNSKTAQEEAHAHLMALLDPVILTAWVLNELTCFSPSGTGRYQLHLRRLRQGRLNLEDAAQCHPV